jgi:Predicted N-acetylglucosaminyl transferase
MQDRTAKIDVPSLVETLAKTEGLNHEVGSLYSEALYAFEEKKYEESLSHFQQMISLLPSDKSPQILSEAYRWAANCHYYSSDLIKAMELLDKAIKLYKSLIQDPNYLASLYDFKASIYNDQNNFQKALNKYHKIIKILEDSGNNAHDLAFAYSNINFAYRKLGDFDQAGKSVMISESMVSANKDIFSEGEKLLLNARASEFLNSIEETKIKYKKAISFYNNNSSSKWLAIGLSELGNLLWAEKEFKVALDCYERSLPYFRAAYGDIHPKVICIVRIIGSLHNQLGMYKEALQDYELILNASKEKFYPGATLGEILLDAGCSCMSLNQNQKAKEYLTKALEFFLSADPENPNISACYSNLGDLFWIEGNCEKAQEMFEKAIAQITKVHDENHFLVAAPTLMMGNIHWQKGRYEDALKAYEKTKEIYIVNDGENSEYLDSANLNIGFIYLEKGDYESALTYYQKSLECFKTHCGEDHPGISEKYYRMGEVLSRKGALTKALEFAIKAVRLDEQNFGKDNLEVAKHSTILGYIYIHQQKPKEAIEVLEKCVAIFQQNPSANEIYSSDAYSWLGHAQIKSKDYSQALTNILKGLEIKIKLYGESHPETARVYYILGLLQKAQENYEESFATLEKSLSIMKKFFDDSHPEVAEYEATMKSVKQKVPKL